MIKYESFCNGCRSVGLSCMGSGCDNYYKKPVYYCDKCGDELYEIYNVDGEQLCEICLKDMFRECVE